MENDIQKSILKKFMYNGNLKYNQIWDKDLCNSNKFDYHLKLLIRQNLIRKKDDFYELTPGGCQLIGSMDGDKIEVKKKPIACVFIMGYDSVHDKILVNIRKKQPFMDHLGIPGGKIELGNTVYDEAKREFLEETGLSGDLKLKLITNYITYDEETEEIITHIFGYFFVAINCIGDLIEKNREGENMWMDFEDAKSHKKYLDNDFYMKVLLDKNENIIFKEAKRYVRNGEFTRIEFLD